jgi:hypothetical protein
MNTPDRRRTSRGLACALALAAPLSWGSDARAEDDLAADVGVVLSLHLYSVGLMDYCYDEIEKRQAFKDASQAWRTRNAEAMTLEGTLLPKAAKAEEIAAVITQIKIAIATDLAAQPDKVAACQTAADSLNDPSSDVAARAPDQFARVKAAVAQ